MEVYYVIENPEIIIITKETIIFTVHYDPETTSKRTVLKINKQVSMCEGGSQGRSHDWTFEYKHFRGNNNFSSNCMDVYHKRVTDSCDLCGTLHKWFDLSSLFTCYKCKVTMLTIKINKPKTQPYEFFSNLDGGLISRNCMISQCNFGKFIYYKIFRGLVIRTKVITT